MFPHKAITLSFLYILFVNIRISSFRYQPSYRAGAVLRSLSRPSGYDPRPGDFDYQETFTQVQYEQGQYYPTLGLESMVHSYGDLRQMTFADYQFSFFLFPLLKGAAEKRLWPSLRSLPSYERSWLEQSTNYRHKYDGRDISILSREDRLDVSLRLFRNTLFDEKSWKILIKMYQPSFNFICYLKRVRIGGNTNNSSDFADSQLMIDLPALWSDAITQLLPTSPAINNLRDSDRPTSGIDRADIPYRDHLYREFLIYLTQLLLRIAFSNPHAKEVFLPYPSLKWLHGKFSYIFTLAFQSIYLLEQSKYSSIIPPPVSVMLAISTIADMVTDYDFEKVITNFGSSSQRELFVAGRKVDV